MKLNLPNKITITRILLLPLFIFFYLANFILYGKFIAALIFIIAVSTDFIDGRIARKTQQVTTLGKFLDPIADKLVVAAALILLVSDRVFAIAFMETITIIIISREFIVTGFRQVASAKNVIIAADKFGKLKAVFQDIAIAFAMVYSQFLLVSLNKSLLLSFEIASYVLLVIATILTILSGVNYVAKNKNVFNSN